MSTNKTAIFLPIFFLLLIGTLIAWLSDSKQEAVMFVFFASFVIVTFGAIQPKEKDDESDVLYFDLSAKKDDPKIVLYKKYFAGMAVALPVMSAPTVIKYYFLFQNI